MPPPGRWEQAALPAGVLAETDLDRLTVRWDRRLLELHPLVIAAVVLHESCHLRGHISEDSADCCAVLAFSAVYGPSAVPLIVEFWVSRRATRRAETWLECAP
jgi:hypothetical protein